jgi:hypothetical protein
MSIEERRERLRQRTRESAEDRGKQHLGKSQLKGPLDLSLAGQEIKWLSLIHDPRNPPMFDIIPFEVRRPEYAAMKQFTGKLTNRVVGDWDYKLEISVHHKIGINQSPVLCLREMLGMKCPICDDMFEEYRKKGTADFNEKLAKALRPQWRCVYKVYDYRDESYNGFKLFDFSYMHFEEPLCERAETSEEGYVTFSDPFDGRVLEVQTTLEKIGDKNDYVKPAFINFLKRSDPYTEEDISLIPLDEMLIIPSYEEVCQIYFSSDTCQSDMEENNANPNQSQPQEAPTARRRPEPQRQEPSQPQEAPTARRRPEQQGQESSQRDAGNACGAGGNFGSDFQKFEYCQSECSDEIYNKCEKRYGEISQQRSLKNQEAPQVRRRPEPQKEENSQQQSSDSQRVVRRRR